MLYVITSPYFKIILNCPERKLQHETGEKTPKFVPESVNLRFCPSYKKDACVTTESTRGKSQYISTSSSENIKYYQGPNDIIL